MDEPRIGSGAAGRVLEGLRFGLRSATPLHQVARRPGLRSPARSFVRRGGTSSYGAKPHPLVLDPGEASCGGARRSLLRSRRQVAPPSGQPGGQPVHPGGGGRKPPALAAHDAPREAPRTGDGGRAARTRPFRRCPRRARCRRAAIARGRGIRRAAGRRQRGCRRGSEGHEIGRRQPSREGAGHLQGRAWAGAGLRGRHRRGNGGFQRGCQPDRQRPFRATARAARKRITVGEPGCRRRRARGRRRRRCSAPQARVGLERRQVAASQ